MNWIFHCPKCGYELSLSHKGKHLVCTNCNYVEMI